MSQNHLRLSIQQLQKDPSAIISLIKNQQIGVMPTDTLYGLVGSALSQKAVEKIYRARRRSETKPLIILISDIQDLKLFNIEPSSEDLKIISQLWPNPVSIILPVPDDKWQYLHRGTRSLAFRVPNDQFLQNFLSQTGPIGAPSANLEGQPPARDIHQAQHYFQNKAQFYIDAGLLDRPPSTLASIDNGQLHILREGAWQP